MVSKKDAAAKVDQVESWYRSKKYWVQVIGLLAVGIAIGLYFG